MRTVTKKELADKVAALVDTHKNVTREIVSRLLDVMADELSQGNRIELRGLGVFQTANKPERVRHNPQTLEKVTLPASRVVRFKTSSKLQKKLNNL